MRLFLVCGTGRDFSVSTKFDSLMRTGPSPRSDTCFRCSIIRHGEHQYFSGLPNECSELMTFDTCRFAVTTMLRQCPSDSLDARRAARPGAFATVQPTTAIRHGAGFAKRAASCSRTAVRRARKIACPIAVLEATAPRCMGSLLTFLHISPLPRLRRGSRRRQSPGRLYEREHARPSPFAVRSCPSVSPSLLTVHRRGALG